MVDEPHFHIPRATSLREWRGFHSFSPVLGLSILSLRMVNPLVDKNIGFFFFFLFPHGSGKHCIDTFVYLIRNDRSCWIACIETRRRGVRRHGLTQGTVRGDQLRRAKTIQSRDCNYQATKPHHRVCSSVPDSFSGIQVFGFSRLFDDPCPWWV